MSHIGLTLNQRELTVVEGLHHWEVKGSYKLKISRYTGKRERPLDTGWQELNTITKLYGISRSATT